MAGDLTLLVTTAETKQHTHNIEHTILSKLLRTHVITRLPWQR